MIRTPSNLFHLLSKAVNSRKEICRTLCQNGTCIQTQMLKHAKALSESDGCCIFNLALKRLIWGTPRFYIWSTHYEKYKLSAFYGPPVGLTDHSCYVMAAPAAFSG